MAGGRKWEGQSRAYCGRHGWRPVAGAAPRSKAHFINCLGTATANGPGPPPQLGGAIGKAVNFQLFFSWLAGMRVSVKCCTAASRRQSRTACWGAQELGQWAREKGDPCEGCGRKQQKPRLGEGTDGVLVRRQWAALHKYLLAAHTYAACQQTRRHHPGAPAASRCAAWSQFRRYHSQPAAPHPK